MTKPITPILKLSAYLVREACGLRDTEVVMLDVGAEAVRNMALAAVEAWDQLQARVEELESTATCSFCQNCSFCQKGPPEVNLIIGPKVSICFECVDNARDNMGDIRIHGRDD